MKIGDYNGIGLNGVKIISNYNDVWNNALGSYNGSSAGAGDISADPLFANPTTGDFHLKSQGGRWTPTGWVTDSVTSPCIDAGVPADDYSKEPYPNGGGINIGAYGNTAEASKSASAILPPDLPDDKSSRTKFSVYPNPYIAGKVGTNKIIFAGLSAGAEIKIYDVSGKLVQELSTGSDGKAEWDVSNVSSWVYLYVITSAEGVKKGKISIIK